MDKGGSVVARRRLATPQGDYEGTVRAIADLVQYLDHESGSRGSVGVGMPGIVSPATGLVKNANSVCLNGRPLNHDLERALARPVRIENDANCFALSEASDGAASNRPCVFGVILGTGTGGGVVVNGRLLRGRNAVAGEWGHNPLPWQGLGEWPGESCYCGRTGCIETWLSGPALARDYEQENQGATSASDIASRAQSGEAAAILCIDRYVNRLARALASIINVLDPEAIVLGGGLSSIDRLYTDVPRQWARFVFSDRVETELLPPKFGDSSGIRGAAWLWPET